MLIFGVGNILLRYSCYKYQEQGSGAGLTRKLVQRTSLGAVHIHRTPRVAARLQKGACPVCGDDPNVSVRLRYRQAQLMPGTSSTYPTLSI